jgi:hypothetical protein
MEPLCLHQFGCALLATASVLLKLVPGVITKFVVEIQRQILTYPIAIHKCL